jgi:transcriptional adapter 2-alpha
MTVTKRKARDDTQAVAPTIESGIKASCDSCSADVTHSVHVRCAVCSDFDLCVPVRVSPLHVSRTGKLTLLCGEQCFLAGKQVGPHRSSHPYRIISSHAFPIFKADWGADEELLLIEGAELYGLGNWADMAEHVGGRTKEECEKHYMETYIWSSDYPLPVRAAPFCPLRASFLSTSYARRSWGATLVLRKSSSRTRREGWKNYKLDHWVSSIFRSSVPVS